MHISEFIAQANDYGTKRIPFFFLVDFELQKPVIFLKNKALEHGFLFNVKGDTNFTEYANISRKKNHLKSYPIQRTKFTEAFNLVSENILKGNSYLLNLTFPTPLDTNITLESIFQRARASYSLYSKEQFVLFSPECFVQTKDDQIFSYPMKGTIDASIPQAEQIILHDKKETWEHNTIVDLIRNDLSTVAQNIMVTKFRYIDRIKTDRNELLQVSSEIRGDLSKGWRSRIGSMLVDMLPAGSISGAPKKKAIEIIRSAEKQNRGYYTGIFGIFDGRDIDSAVNIRYIEKVGNSLQYRSGGGITAMSDINSEYQEMLDKIYVPVA